MPEIVPPLPLAQLTTLRVGGAPERMIEARTRDELVETLRDVWADREPWTVLGGGSNVLVGDDEIEGVVVLIRTEGIEEVPSARSGFVRLRVEAGHEWDELVRHTVDAGLAGIEALSGIPGTAGAAPIQNIGAYGQEVVQTLVEVELLDESTGEVTTVSASDLGLGLRTSVLKRHHGDVPERSAVVVSITLELEEVGGDARPIRGEQLRTALGLAPEAQVSVGWIRDRVLEIRRGKGMVLDDADPDTCSAGSFFQNPVVSESFARTLPEGCPRWPMTPDLPSVRVIPLEEYVGLWPTEPPAPAMVKVSAAWLIEQSGLPKGFRIGRSRAALSTKHTLALTNRGGATGAELAQLARFVQQRVSAEYGVNLQPEPVLLGIEL